MTRLRPIAAALALLALAAPARADENNPAKAAADNRPTVAVLYFDYAGKDEQMAVLRKGLAQMLISDLSALDQVRIVERERLQEVLDEIKLGGTAKIDPASAARAGKLLGARFMVLGSYFDLMGALRADARLVEVETGRVIRSTGANGKPDDFLTVEQKLGDELTKMLTTQLPPRAADAGRVKAPDDKPRVAAPKKPAQLKTKTAVQYAKALDAMDKGNKAAAKEALQTVVKEQPDFRLAAADLDRLMQ